MIPFEPPIDAQEPTRMPADLSDWTGRHGLACLALEAATETAGKAFAGLFDADPAGLTRAKTLLALLTYCYAAGIHASDEIELRALDDPMVRYLGGNALPDWSRLRSFRRQWHSAIHDSLMRVFLLAWTRHRDNTQTGEAGGDRSELVQRGAADPTTLWHFAVEVERRISRAVLLDSMFADD